jgi:hypothetical protein
MGSVASDTVPSGEAARRDFRCAACGYGVVVLRSLPRCPMCAGQVWIASARGALSTELPADVRRMSVEPAEVDD